MRGRPAHIRVSAALAAGALLGATLALALPHPDIARGAASRSTPGPQRAGRVVASQRAHRIFFWGDVAEAVRAPGQRPQPEVIRPALIIMFQDGSWVIEHLRWKGWGSPRAHATGISSASNGIPNMAEGRRIRRAARVTLSKPQRFHGRDVYSCFTLSISGSSKGTHLCLKEHNHYWLLMDARRRVPSWQRVAAHAGSSIYRPRLTPGLRLTSLSVNRYGCVSASWAGSGKLRRSRLRVSEPSDTVQCGQPGVSTRVASAVIEHRKVAVSVQCAQWPHCTRRDGETTGQFLMMVPEGASGHYLVQLESNRMRMGALLKIARSLAPVR